MVVGQRQREIDDGEQDEDERLQGTYQKVEPLEQERPEDRRQDREVDRPDRDMPDDHLIDDEQQQLADEDVEKETQRERRRAQYLFQYIDRQHRKERLDQVFVETDAFFADAADLNDEKDHDRIGHGRVQVCRRRPAERHSQCLEREKANLVQQKDEDEKRDEERYERLTLGPDRAVREIRDIVDQAFQNGLAFADARRFIRRCNPPKERQRHGHDQPRGQDRIRMHRPNDGQMPEGVFANLLVQRLFCSLGRSARHADDVKRERYKQRYYVYGHRPPRVNGRENPGDYTARRHTQETT